MSSKSQDYVQINRDAWAYLARHGCDASQPYGSYQFSFAYQLLDPEGWIPWSSIKTVLCLAGGGGQQGPLFAALGLRVTVVDLSPDQLNLDRLGAEQLGLSIECVEADMLDLSYFQDRQFDLIYQPVSACYVPDVRRVYHEVARLLAAGGYYWVQHWNPVQIQLSSDQSWDGSAYRIAHPQQPNQPVVWKSRKGHQSDPGTTCWHFIHPLSHLIGGLCDAGFIILRFTEGAAGDLRSPPGSDAHLAAYIPPFYTLFSQKR